MIQDIKKAKDTHNKLREILIKYNSPEYGDCIVDEISWLFDFPTTIDVEPEEEEVTNVQEETNVSFYLATYDANESDEQPYKEVVAVFVDEIETNKPKDDVYYSCYVHLGGHTTCSQSFLAQNCRKINVNSTEEYQDLKTELESIGYNLNII